MEYLQTYIREGHMFLHSDFEHDTGPKNIELNRAEEIMRNALYRRLRIPAMQQTNDSINTLRFIIKVS